MRCFVYGTLRDAGTASDAVDDVSYAGAATLEGLHRVEGEYSTLAPGGSVDGRVLVTDDAAALDRYEGVDRGLYVRVPVPTPDGDVVETYVAEPHRVDGPVAWPGTGPFRDRVLTYVGEHDVVVRPAD